MVRNLSAAFYASILIFQFSLALADRDHHSPELPQSKVETKAETKPFSMNGTELYINLGDEVMIVNSEGFFVNPEFYKAKDAGMSLSPEPEFIDYDANQVQYPFFNATEEDIEKLNDISLKFAEQSDNEVQIFIYPPPVFGDFVNGQAHPKPPIDDRKIFLSKRKKIYRDSSIIKNNVYERSGFSLAPDLKVVGPVMDQTKSNGREFQSTQEYVQKIFRAILLSAASYALGGDGLGDFKYEPGGNANWTYYSFLVTALAVPLHESKLQHFRLKDYGKCERSKGDVQKASRFEYVYDKKFHNQANHGYAVNARMSKAKLEEIYKDDYEPLMLTCEQLKGQKEITQLVTINPQLNPDKPDVVFQNDVGIGMFNITSHPYAIEPDILLSVYNSIDYVVSLLFDGFKEIRSKLHSGEIKNYTGRGGKCWKEFTKNPWGTKLNYTPWAYGLPITTWSSKYNKGQTKLWNICRFVDPTDKHYEKDVSFINETFLPMIKNETSIFHIFLPEGSVERKAFLEILHNYRSIFVSGVDKEINANILAILNDQPKDIESVRAGRNLFELSHVFKKSGDWGTPIYDSPSENANICTRLRSNGALKVSEGATLVGAAVEFEHDDPSTVEELNEKWTMIEMPKHGERIKSGFDRMATLGKVEGKLRSHYNLRTFPVDPDSNYLAETTSETKYSERLERKKDGGKWYRVIKEQKFKNWKQTWVLLEYKGAKVWTYRAGLDIKLRRAADAPSSCFENIGYVKSEDLQYIRPKVSKSNRATAWTPGNGTHYIYRHMYRSSPIIEVLNPNEKIGIIGSYTKFKNSHINAQLWYKVLTDKSARKWGWIPATSVESIDRRLDPFSSTGVNIQ